MPAALRTSFLLALGLAIVGGPAALAIGTIQVIRGPVTPPGPNTAICAPGFTAIPNTINGAGVYSQSYTCTGSNIQCSPRFVPQPSVAATLPPQPGQILGHAIYGSPVTIKNGAMVYTCAEPPPPPH